MKRDRGIEIAVFLLLGLLVSWAASLIYQGITHHDGVWLGRWIFLGWVLTGCSTWWTMRAIHRANRQLEEMNK